MNRTNNLKDQLISWHQLTGSHIRPWVIQKHTVQYLTPVKMLSNSNPWQIAVVWSIKKRHIWLLVFHFSSDHYWFETVPSVCSNHESTVQGLYIRAGSWRSSPASLPGFTGYFHCFTSLNMSRGWTHNRLLFTKLRLLKNVKKTLNFFLNKKLSIFLARSDGDVYEKGRETLWCSLKSACI